MNNKLFARIMTAVICLCMMSTVVFAANPALEAGADETTKVINFMSTDEAGNPVNIIAPVVADGATAPEYVTMMAFCVAGEGTEYVNETTTPMIAIDQVAYGSVWENVAVLASKIDAAKAAGMDKIVVKTGDSNEGGSTWVVSQDEETGAITITVAYTLDDGTLAEGVTNPAEVDGNTTIAAFFEGVTAPTLGTYASALNPKFEGWYTDAAFATKVNTASTEAMSTLLAEGADSLDLYARYTIDIVSGDINLDGKVAAADTNILILWTKIPAATTPANNNKRAALKEQYPDYKFAEEYTLVNDGSKFVVGDVDFSTKVAASDTNVLKLWTKIPAATTPANNNKRAALKEQYPDYKFAEVYTVYVK